MKLDNSPEHIEKLLAELRLAKEKAEESDRLKTSFLANMSHEIRTPLNGIIGFSQLIASVDLSIEKKKKYVKLIEHSSNQLLHIIEDLLDLAKMETGTFELQLRPCNINRLFAELYSIFKSEMEYKQKSHINLLMQTPASDKNAIINTDPDRLRQVLYNLINNALKFTSEGEIEYAYKFNGTEVLFFVRDTGIGIGQNKQKIIFDIFRQEDESHTRKYGGTGLGLSICKRIVEHLGGEIWLDSHTNVGTTIFFTLPYASTSDEKHKQKRGEIASENSDRKSVLIVDDITEVHFYIREILQNINMNCKSANNGSEAVEMVKQENFDLILLDIQMPDIDGYITLNRIRELNSDIPVIAQTANALESDRERAKKEGCDGFLTKPFTPDDLVDEVKRVLKL